MEARFYSTELPEIVHTYKRVKSVSVELDDDVLCYKLIIQENRKPVYYPLDEWRLTIMGYRGCA